jgi:hypothetical protein
MHARSREKNRRIVFRYQGCRRNPLVPALREEIYVKLPQLVCRHRVFPFADGDFRPMSGGWQAEIKSLRAAFALLSFYFFRFLV